jgi:hypothetical protein
MDGRCIVGCLPIYKSYAHGSKGIAIVSKDGDCGLPSSTYKGQNTERGNVLWTSEVKPDERDPYTNEWNDLTDAIRNDKPYNEAEYGAMNSMTGILGRMCTYSGLQIDWDDAINSQIELVPNPCSWDTKPPVLPDADGWYSVAKPGKTVTV